MGKFKDYIIYDSKIVDNLILFYKHNLFFVKYLLIFLIYFLYTNSDLNYLSNLCYSIIAFLLLISTVGLLLNYILFLCVILFSYNNDGYLKRLFFFAIFPLSYYLLTSIIDIQGLYFIPNAYYQIIVIGIIGISLLFISIKIFIMVFR